MSPPKLQRTNIKKVKKCSFYSKHFIKVTMRRYWFSLYQLIRYILAPLSMQKIRISSYVLVTYTPGKRELKQWRLLNSIPLLLWKNHDFANSFWCCSTNSSYFILLFFPLWGRYFAAVICWKELCNLSVPI